MAGLVLGAWVIQAAVGVGLLRQWLRHSPSVAGTPRPGAVVVIAHAALSVLALCLWTAFVVTQTPLFGWVAFGLLTIGNGVGDTLLVRRSRRTSGAGPSWRTDYRTAVAAVFARRFPPPVTFHALFAGVVYFGALAACLTA